MTNPHAHGNTRPDAWTPEEDGVLMDLYTRGAPVDEIADRMARTKSAVRQRAVVIGARRPLRTPTLDRKPIT
jgi:hypothetical protein